LQCAVIEFARNVCGYEDANSREFDRGSSHPVIHLMPEQEGSHDKGGNMRRGKYSCRLTTGSKVQQAYGTDEVVERHRHRYEINNEYREEFEAQGMMVSGVSPDGSLIEIIELSDHPWFVGCQFHPEFKSRPNRPHPLFSGFIQRALARSKQ